MKKWKNEGNLGYFQSKLFWALITQWSSPQVSGESGSLVTALPVLCLKSLLTSPL